MMSSRLLARRVNAALLRSHKAQGVMGGGIAKEGRRDLSTVSASGKWESPVRWVLAGALVTVASVGSSQLLNNENATTSLEAFGTLSLGPTAIEEPMMDSSAAKGKSDDSLVEEPATGIYFPPVFQSKHLLGLGVRKKFSFFNVYAVAFYVNPQDFRSLDEEGIEDALLDPNKHRIVRIIMNRTVTMDTVIAALIESVEPRMNGKDLHALDHFSKLKSYGCLAEGDDIVLTIHGGTLECNCSNGGYNVVESEVFTRAICDVYFGKQPISPSAKASALDGIREV